MWTFAIVTLLAFHFCYIDWTIANSWSVRVYDNANHKGTYRRFAGYGTGRLVDISACFNDRVTSFQFYPQGGIGCICFHMSTSGAGPTRCFWESSYDFWVMGINDRTSSFSVHRKSDPACISVLHNAVFPPQTVQTGC